MGRRGQAGAPGLVVAIAKLRARPHSAVQRSFALERGAESSRSAVCLVIQWARVRTLPHTRALGPCFARDEELARACVLLEKRMLLL